MKKSEILQSDAPVLRKIAKSISPEEIKSEKIQNILKRMRKALQAEEDGVAIAAPQIGESVRIFITGNKGLDLKDMTFINPVIIKASKKKRRMEEGCLSVRWLYGKVRRSEKITVRAYDENGKLFERGASGLLAQIFQHEMDHLDGVLFIDKAQDLREIPPSPPEKAEELEAIKFVFFGSSEISKDVLAELERVGLKPIMKITSAKEDIPMDELKKIDADLFIVASFGKILPKELIEMPKHGTLNVHPSLLPKLRGASPIQNLILGKGEPGVTIIKMDEKMDHGPIVAQAKVVIDPWPDHYRKVEEKLGRAGGIMLASVLTKWIAGKIKAIPQDDDNATYIKMIKKEDGLLDLAGPAEENYRKVLAYSTWPGAYLFYRRKNGKELRVVVKEAVIKEGKFLPTRVIPEGKREMAWDDFIRN